jgi:hypothetical protein
MGHLLLRYEGKARQRLLSVRQGPSGLHFVKLAALSVSSCMNNKHCEVFPTGFGGHNICVHS